MKIRKSSRRRRSVNALYVGEPVRVPRHQLGEHPVHIDKAEILAILRSRGLHDRADWVDRTLPPIVDTGKSGSLLRMLDIDVTTMFPAGQATPNEPDLIGR